MPLNGYEKAAIFLSCVGEEAAAEALKDLDVRDIGKITMHMTRLKTVNTATVDYVMKEASDMISRGDLHIGGEEFVKKVLARGLGEDGATKILEMASKEGTLDSLKWVDSKTLSNFLLSEHPQTIALVVSMLEPGHAAEVISSLPEKLTADVAIRIATSERILESALEDLDDVLKSQMDITKGKGKKVGGIKMIAETLNQCDRTLEQKILEKIQEKDDLLADSIRQFMFVFDDLVKVDDRGIQMILKDVNTEKLALAMKISSDSLKEKIFKNMSQRAAQMLKEEIQVKGPVRVSEVEKAQQDIVKVAKKLETEGAVILMGRGDEDIVV